MTVTTVSIERKDTVAVGDTDIKYVGSLAEEGTYYRKVCCWPPWSADDSICDLLDVDDTISSIDPDDALNTISIKLVSGSSSRITVEVTRNKPDTSPTITDLSWSPKGEYKVLSAGALLVGATEQLKVITTNHADYPDLIDEGEAYLERVDLEGNSLEVFAVAEYDHFRFDNEEWWALNIICGPECDIVTFANETAEALKTPKVGDEIQFTCSIDWHGVDPDKVEWYYAKAPNRCFDAEEAADLWERFATTQLPTHTFEAEDDHEIVFLKVIAKNANGDISELGGICDPIFNLWKPESPGFVEGWLIAPFMAYILPGLAETFEYLCDLVFDGTTDPDTPSGGFSLLWAPVAFVTWIAEELAEVAEDILDLVFGISAAESTGGFSIFWSAANFVQWIYRSVAAMFEDILDLVFAD